MTNHNGDVGKMSDVFDLPVRRHYQVITMQGEIQRADTDAIEAAVHAINQHDALVAQVELMKEALQDASDYLDTNKETSIGSGSKLHTKFKDILEGVGDE